MDLRKLIQYFYFLAKITIFAGILQLQQDTMGCQNIRCRYVLGFLVSGGGFQGKGHICHVAGFEPDTPHHLLLAQSRCLGEMVPAIATSMGSPSMFQYGWWLPCFWCYILQHSHNQIKYFFLCSVEELRMWWHVFCPLSLELLPSNFQYLSI